MKNIIEQLNQLKEDVKDCFECSLCKNRTNTVFSDGCETAPVMFIGEAPGKNEDETGLPFVGRAGQLLRKFLIETGFNQKDFYIANTVKCRPPENRKPTNKEKKSCQKFLEKQIELVDPKLIVLVGSTALESFMIEKTTIKRVNDVIMMTIDGASDKMVIRARTPKIRAEAVPVETSSMFRLMFCARAGLLNSKTVPNRIAGKNNFLIMGGNFRWISLQQQIGAAEQN